MAKPVKKAKEEKKAIVYSNAKEAVKKTEERGAGGGPTSYKLPKGVSRFKFEEAKTYKLNIVPYRVGEGNPNADAGQVHYERTFDVHRGVGAEDNSYTCLKTFGERCPICEHVVKLQREGADKDTIKEIKAKTRQLYLVQDSDNLDAGVQVFETGYFMSFGELLANKIKSVEEDDDSGYDRFFHLGEDGKLLRVLVQKDSFNGQSYNKPISIEMRDRKSPVDPELLDQVPCLDDLLVKLSYQDLKKKFEEGDSESDDEEDDDDTEAEDSDEEDDDDAPPPKKKDKKAKPAEEEEEEEFEVEADDETEDEEEAEESEDENDEEETEDEEAEVEISKKTINGKKIKFKNKAGKEMVGVVVLANDASEVAMVKVEGQAKNEQAKYDTISLVGDEDEEEAEDEDEETEDDEEAEDEAESEEAEESEEEDDEEWDLDDEEEEEEKPAPKKKVATKVESKKPAAKVKPKGKK